MGALAARTGPLSRGSGTQGLSLSVVLVQQQWEGEIPRAQDEQIPACPVPPVQHERAEVQDRLAMELI
eukprot:12169759-Prorocentrum_lima.AAC.1